MKSERPIRVHRETLLRYLTWAEPGLSAKDTVQQSSCFVFQDGKLVTYNDEVACRQPTPLKSLEGAVQAKPLLEILRKLEDEEIEISNGGNFLILEGSRRSRKKKSRRRWKTEVLMEATVDMPLEGVEQPGEWKPLPQDFVDGIGMVQQCTLRESQATGQDFQFTCIHITPKWVEASDNDQMIRYRIRTGFSAPVLIRKESLKNAASLGIVEFSEGDTWIHFRNRQGLEVSCRRYLEEFVKMGEFLKMEGETLILPKKLGRTLECASVFSSDADNKSDDLVWVELKPGRVLVRGEGVKGKYEEERKLRYSGPPIEFLIPPKLLIDITEKYNECRIDGDKIKVKGENWTYIALLTPTTDAMGIPEEEEYDGGEGGEDE